MKRTPAIAIAAATLLVAVMLWRQHVIEGELAALRAALENAPAPAVRTPVEVAQEPRRTATPIAAAERTPAQLQERIEDLERLANGHADLIEELLRKFSDMEAARQKAIAPAWSVLQVIGPPDTMSDGDHSTAWAPAQQDGGAEWLVTEFAQPVEVVQVVVRETCGPGCITKITTVTDAGTEVTLWQGTPPKNASPSNTVFNIPPGTTTGRIKVYLDTSLVAGWNEIDAVQLVGRDGSRQWAKNASASSSYGGAGTIDLNLGLERERGGLSTQQRSYPVDLFSLGITTETTAPRPR